MKFSKLSAIILNCSVYYATFYGIIFFKMKRNNAIECNWLKWYCLISRLSWSFVLTYSILPWLFEMEDSNAVLLHCVRLTGCLICSVCIMVLQHIYGQDLLRLVNKFLKLYQRVCNLRTLKRKGYGGRREFILILLILCTSLYQTLILLRNVAYYTNVAAYIGLAGDIFIAIGCNMIMQICFIGYLSLGYLFAELNGYASNELRNHLRSLSGSVNRIQLQAASYRLDKFLSIYNEIQSIGHAFNRLFELPLFMVLLLNMTIMGMLSYVVVLEFNQINLNNCGVIIKLLIDIVILSQTVYEAVSKSRIIKRLGFENYYITDHKEWNLKLEMFLSRLNFYEFRVRPLGLFDLSNEFTVLFLSGLVTYLAFILQYGMRMNKI